MTGSPSAQEQRVGVVTLFDINVVELKTIREAAAFDSQRLR
jgi:hypothetical protein